MEESYVCNFTSDNESEKNTDCFELFSHIPACRWHMCLPCCIRLACSMTSAPLCWERCTSHRTSDFRSSAAEVKVFSVNILTTGESTNELTIHSTGSHLTLRLLMSYMYGAPSKGRNANVVYIWTYVWQRWNSLFLFAAQCFNTESMQRVFLCHICV